jgi:hypothetical protein
MVCSICARSPSAATWEVVSKVMYFLDLSAAAQGDFLDWLFRGHERGLMRIAALAPADDRADFAVHRTANRKSFRNVSAARSA